MFRFVFLRPFRRSSECQQETSRTEPSASIGEVAPASVNLWLKVLRILCNWAVRRKVMPAVPFTLKLLKVQKRPRPTLAVSRAELWLAAIDRLKGERHGVAVAVRLMLGMGLREAETITARWEWLDWDRKLYVPGITKGREADPVPVPKWLADYLAPMRQPAGLIVVKRDGGGFAHGFTRRAMLAANTACGVGHITAHRLRGTFATLLSEAGVPVQTIQKVMRHKSPLTTMAYLEVNLHRVADAQANIARQVGLAASGQSERDGEEMANAPCESTA
jgi:integrase/recombinase XerC